MGRDVRVVDDEVVVERPAGAHRPRHHRKIVLDVTVPVEDLEQRNRSGAHGLISP
jgi:hypothetical protein